MRKKNKCEQTQLEWNVDAASTVSLNLDVDINYVTDSPLAMKVTLVPRQDDPHGCHLIFPPGNRPIQVKITLFLLLRMRKSVSIQWALPIPLSVIIPIRFPCNLAWSGLRQRS